MVMLFFCSQFLESVGETPPLRIAAVPKPEQATASGPVPDPSRCSVKSQECSDFDSSWHSEWSLFSLDHVVVWRKLKSVVFC